MYARLPVPLTTIPLTVVDVTFKVEVAVIPLAGVVQFIEVIDEVVPLPLAPQNA
jgi:hypothetical protein